MFIISTIQFRPKFATCQADVGNNYRLLSTLLNQAARIESELIVLPELCLTGYSFLNRDEASKVVEPFDGKTFQVMRALALKANAYISWGYPEIDPGSGKLYNSGTMVSPDGEIVTRYRKINLFGSDFLWATPGTEHPQIIQTKFGRTSIIICRDIRNKYSKNIPRTASDDVKIFQENIDLVAGSTNWGKGAFIPNTFMDFVADNKCILAIADRWGIECNNGMENDFGQGKSCIITPNWKIHKDGLVFEKNCVVTAII